MIIISIRNKKISFPIDAHAVHKFINPICAVISASVTWPEIVKYGLDK